MEQRRDCPGPSIRDINKEVRVEKAVQEYRDGIYKNIKAACRAWDIEHKYFTVRGRLKGAHSRTENGGHNTLLLEDEELALLSWINLQISAGMYVLLSPI